MKKIAILVEEQYQVLEVWYPFLRLREEKMEPLFIGTSRREFKSKEGYPVEAGMSIRDVRPADFDAVIIPGGWAPDFLRRYREVNDFVKEMHALGKIVAGICHAGWVLASAGVLKGKKATCFIAIKDDVVNAGADYRDEEVVVDGNLITARTPYDLPAFCAAVINKLR